MERVLTGQGLHGSATTTQWRYADDTNPLRTEQLRVGRVDLAGKGHRACELPDVARLKRDGHETELVALTQKPLEDCTRVRGRIVPETKCVEIKERARSAR